VRDPALISVWHELYEVCYEVQAFLSQLRVLPADHPPHQPVFMCWRRWDLSSSALSCTACAR
jgi:hypothetical protein